MTKHLSKQEKINLAIIALINEMFKIAGHSVTFDDIKDRKDDWYSQWTMTEAEYDQWKKWGIEYLRKNLKMDKTIAEREMAMVGLNWGLKFAE
jgi:hypothetical protein